MCVVVCTNLHWSRLSLSLRASLVSCVLGAASIGEEDLEDVMSDLSSLRRSASSCTSSRTTEISDLILQGIPELLRSAGAYWSYCVGILE